MSRPGAERAVPAGLAAGPLLVAFAAMLWGTVGAASDVLYGLAPVPPLAVGFFRLALAVPLLVLWCWWRVGRDTFRFDGADGWRIVALGAAQAAYQVFYFRAVAEVGVAVATLVTICSAPVLIAALAVGVLKEPLTRRLVAALAVGLAGAALLVGAPRDGAWSPHALWGLGSAAAYAVFVILSRTLAHHDPGKLVAVGFGTGALLLAPFALAGGLGLAALPAAAWGMLVYIGLVPTALAYLVYFVGMRTTAATPASVLTLAEPLTATLIAVVLLGERLEGAALAGAALLVGALALLLRRRAA